MSANSLLILQQANVLAILVGQASLLQFLGKAGIALGTLLQALLLQLNASIDLIQTLLYLLGYGWRSGYMISCGTEAILIGRVLNVDVSAVWRLVGVLAVLHQDAIGIGIEVLQEAGLLVYNAVAGLVFGLVAAILALLLVVLQYGYPGAGLALILTPMVRLIVARNIVSIKVAMMLLLMLMLIVMLRMARKGKQRNKYLN